MAACEKALTIGLYIHVPYCANKCGYCDFYSTVARAGEHEAYVDAVLAELDSTVFSRDVQVATIFVGGGTPTVLPENLLARLFDRLGQISATHQPEEFTVEANPASLTEPKAEILREADVNRISMGAQSFNRLELQTLERIHTPEDIAATAEIVRRSGFDHFNLDLIFGVPGQTLTSWSESITRAIDLGPDHLACYGLTFEPGTPMHERLTEGLVQPVDEQLQVDMYLHTIDQLSAAGFDQYEISNFARPGAQSRHNLRYWHNQPGIGLGPSAASYLKGRRWRNLPDTAEYLRRVQNKIDVAIDSETLPPIARARESAMLQLRLNAGLQCDQFHQSTGFDPYKLFADAIARHTRAGLITADANRIALTRQGRLLADRVIADFLVPDQP